MDTHTPETVYTIEHRCDITLVGCVIDNSALLSMAVLHRMVDTFYNCNANGGSYYSYICTRQLPYIDQLCLSAGTCIENVCKNQYSI